MKIEKDGIQFEDKPISKSAKFFLAITTLTIITCIIALYLVSAPSVSPATTVQRCAYMILLLAIVNVSLSILSLYMLHQILSILKVKERTVS